MSDHLALGYMSFYVRNLASTNNSRGIDICVKNNITRKLGSEITYPFPNIDCITVEVWKWIGNFIPHIIIDAFTYPMLFVRRFCFDVFVFIILISSSNGNIFRVTDHLCGDFTGHRWISHTKAIDAEVWCFLWSRKHQSSASLAFVRWIRGRPVNSPHKWPVTRKMFPFDDVIMWKL